ncbi:GGDEF domain-containing phosphodiesterase [Halobacillus sp. Nhm2S1]|uniref:GGDEF domain-containing phosphodiesterase n=1 Tax=Halobacillus sp. Nhm2S1 TaxID=2866716 RepID=UPI001C730775|nr:GGDEF domain-containing phosphodiesterase [Halobacillus sp. Nhm2S1]MBX0359609.1 EAL domain-containing protein [Halobacillus sp. Nhm2S1]
MARTIEHPWNTLKQLSIPIWFFDIEKENIYVSERLKSKWKLDSTLLSCWDLQQLIPKDDLAYMDHQTMTKENRHFFYMNYRLMNDGKYEWMKDIVTPFFDEDGNIIGYTGMSAPHSAYIEELGRIKEAIVEIGDAFLSYNGQEFFDFLVEYLSSVLDVETVLVGELTGEAKNEVTAISFSHKGITSSGLRYALKNTPCEQVTRFHECYYPNDVGTLFPEDQTIKDYGVESYHGKALLNSDGEVIGILAIMDYRTQTSGPLSKALFQIFADRTANELSRMQAEKKLEMLSQYDPLTGLVTRSYLLGILEGEIQSTAEKEHYMALLLIDIDNFKMINDSWGHTKGDELLRQFSRYLRQTFAHHDAVISRISSDEFVVLLRHVQSIEELRGISDHVIHSMRRPFLIGEKEFYNTVSIGVTFTPERLRDQYSGETLLRHADAAMHEAKRSGKNRYAVYEEKMSEQMREELHLKQSLHHALDKHQFELHYQPQVCGRTSQVIGHESLIRWNHPDYGLLSPQYFISLAEESGMIIEIGEWVLNEACQQAKRWQVEDRRPDLKISVNLSAQQFKDFNLSKKVLKALRDSKLPPDSLILEITETMVLQDFERSTDTLNGLREKGIKVHLDDFGVGFSSLSYLNRLPVDAIKIDRSFINQIGEQGEEVPIVNAIISMAKSLGIQVIAEGVETSEHMAYLKQKGCYEYQGYYFSKPVPASLVLN